MAGGWPEREVFYINLNENKRVATSHSLSRTTPPTLSMAAPMSIVVVLTTHHVAVAFTALIPAIGRLSDNEKPGKTLPCLSWSSTHSAPRPRWSRFRRSLRHEDIIISFL